jgi:hypothetical protein
MDWIICVVCAFPFWGAILLYWLLNWLQKRRYPVVLRSDNFIFVKTKEGDLIRKGQSNRNGLALFFLGILEVGLIWVVYVALISNPIEWWVVIGAGFFALIIGWFWVYFLRLARVSPIYFDTQAYEIRFKDNGEDYQIPFSDVGEIEVTHAGPEEDEQEKAIRSTYRIALPVTSSGKSLEVARITGKSKEMNTLRKDELVKLIDAVIHFEEVVRT